MKLKVLLFGFFFLVLISGTANATCLTSPEIMLLGQIANSANVSVNDFLGIFDKICDRIDNSTYNYYNKEQVSGMISTINGRLNNLTYSTDEEFDIIYAEINSTEKRIRNYTEFWVDNFVRNYTKTFEERANIAEAIMAVADIVNASTSIKGITDIVDQRMDVQREFITQRLMDFEFETEKYLTENDLAAFKTNISALMYPRTVIPESPNYVIWVVLGGVVFMLVYVWNKKRTHEIKARSLFDRLPVKFKTPEKRRDIIKVSEIEEAKKISEIDKLRKQKRTQKMKRIRDDIKTDFKDSVKDDIDRELEDDDE